MCDCADVMLNTYNYVHCSVILNTGVARYVISHFNISVCETLRLICQFDVTIVRNFLLVELNVLD